MSSKMFRRRFTYIDGHDSQVFTEGASSVGAALDRELDWLTNQKKGDLIMVEIWVAGEDDD